MLHQPKLHGIADISGSSATLRFYDKYQVQLALACECTFAAHAAPPEVFSEYHTMSNCPAHPEEAEVVT